MRNKFILFLLFLFISFQTFAAKISGVVIDADSTPVIGAVVAIKELGKGTQTDENGAFEFAGVESGTYELVFSMVSYKKMLQTVTVINNKDVQVNVSLKSEANKLSDVVVRTNKVTNTENAVMMEIRKANVTVSGISAAQIGKTTDRNAADVVKRIPGVSITEDRFIVVRGLPERYNTVWLNDGSAPSSEVDKKSFSFDIVPSGLIDRVMVYKTPSPELPGDFAGGMVKIYTTSIPDKNQITISVEGSHRQRSTGSDFTYAPVSSTDWLGYDDGSRGLPEFAGHRVSRNDSNNSQVTKAWGNDWILKQKKQGPDGRFNLSASGIWKLGKVRIGNTFGASYSNISTNYEGTQHSWDSTDMTYSGVDNQSVNNINVGLMNNLGVAFGNSKIEFRNLYNQLGKSYVFVRSTVRDTAIESQVDEMSYALGYESRAIYTSQLSGVHKTKNDKTKYNWTLGYTDVFKNIPNLKRIKYSRPYPTGVEDTTTYVYMAGTNANSTPDAINGGGRYFAELYEHTYSFNHHFNQKFKVMGYEFEANVGNFVEYKNRNFWQRNLGHSIQTGPFANALKSLPINEIFADSNLGYKDRFRLGEGTDSSDKYKVENTLIAGFISVKLPIGKFIVLGGVRYEYNDLFLRGFVNLDSVGPKVNTKFWLPSVNVSYDINDKSLVRVAYGKTLNRPEFREFSPLFFYDFETRTNMYGAMFPTKFADTLDVAQVQNFDLRWEWYPSSGEMVHAGVFYKLFKSPIQTVMEYDDPERRAITYMNAKEAYSRGIEIDIRKDFRFLDNIFNTKFFRNASIVGNAAFIQSELTNDTSVKSNQLANLPLQGQSPYMFNIGLFYQGNTGFQSSLLYNVCGPRLFLLGTQDTPPIGELPFDMLDFKFSKTFYKHYTLNFSVQNILDSKVRRVQDVDQNGKFDKKDYEVLSYKPGRYVSLGVKVRF